MCYAGWLLYQGITAKTRMQEIESRSLGGMNSWKELTNADVWNSDWRLIYVFPGGKYNALQTNSREGRNIQFHLGCVWVRKQNPRVLDRAGKWEMSSLRDPSSKQWQGLETSVGLVAPRRLIGSKTVRISVLREGTRLSGKHSGSRRMRQNEAGCIELTPLHIFQAQLGDIWEAAIQMKLTGPWSSNDFISLG